MVADVTRQTPGNRAAPLMPARDRNTRAVPRRLDVAGVAWSAAESPSILRPARRIRSARDAGDGRSRTLAGLWVRRHAGPRRDTRHVERSRARRRALDGPSPARTANHV